MKNNKIKFPLLKDKKSCWIPFSLGKKCECCGKKHTKDLDGVFICLGGGALKGNKRMAEMSSELVGFLSLTLHDHNYNGKGGYLPIADNTKNGQFEFYFCSTQCLRKFLNHLVDRFEDGIK
jgi:hypothetical protein